MIPTYAPHVIAIILILNLWHGIGYEPDQRRLKARGQYHFDFDVPRRYRW